MTSRDVSSPWALRALAALVAGLSGLVSAGGAGVAIGAAGGVLGVAAGVAASGYGASPAGATSNDIYTVAGGLGEGQATGIAQAPYYIASYGSTVYVADFANNVVRAIDTNTGAETVVAGDGQAGYSGNGGPATQAELDLVSGIAVDSEGDLYISDQAADVIREVPSHSGTQWGISMTAGDIYTIAGIPYLNGSYQGQVCGKLPPHDGVGDDCPATEATLLGPVGLAFDSNGDLIIADQTNNLVRILASGGPNPPSWAPSGMQAGYMYTVAGVVGKQGTAPPANGTPATQAELDLPQGVYVDPSGNLFIGEDLNSAAPVLEIPNLNQTRYGITMTAGDIYTVAGGASANCSSATDGAGDGCPATQVDLTDPAGQLVDSAGNLLTVNYYDDVVQEVSPSTGTMSLVAGIPPGLPQAACSGSTDPLGDGCSATAAPLQYPTALAYATGGSVSGDLLIADAGDVRYVDASGQLENLAGNGFSGLFGLASPVNAEPFLVGAGGYSGDCGTSFPCGTPGMAEFNHPAGMAFGPNGDLYIADADSQRVRMIAAHDFTQYHLIPVSAGYSYLEAGSGVKGFGGNGGSAFTATLNEPEDVAVDAAGDVFVADTGNNQVRMIPRNDGTYFGIAMQQGRIYTVAGGGSGTCQSATDAYGDGCPATDAVLSSPGYIAVDPVNGDLVISDTGDNLVREVNPSTGVITVLAGTGSAGSPGTVPNGLPAASSPVDAPAGVAFDAFGDLYIAASGSDTVAVVPASSRQFFGRSMQAGNLYTIAGTASAGFSGDGGVATGAELDDPTGIAVDPLGNVYVADTGNNRVRVVYAGNDVIETVAGDGVRGYAGDMGPAVDAELWEPRGVAIDPLGGLLISDTGDYPVTDQTEALTGDNRIRAVPGVTIPAAPVGVTATPSSQAATVSWHPVVGFGGMTVSSYTVTANPGGASMTVPGNETSVYFTGLEAGQTYTFSVTDQDSSGTSPPSAPSAPITLPKCTGPAGAEGYWEVASDGGIFAFNAPFCGSMGGIPLDKPVVGMAATPDRLGYWEVASDGGIFSFGDAQFYGSMGGIPLAKPVFAMVPTPDGRGYWEVASDGGIFSFGDAQFYGSCPQYGVCGRVAPIVGIATTPDGNGYYLVDADGNVTAFGDANFHQFGGVPGGDPSAPIVGIATTPDGLGYWLVAANGAVYNFGDAGYYGSMAGKPLNKPIVGMAVTPDGKGYWLIASDGGIFSFGDAQFYGSMGGVQLVKPVVGGAGE
jgi:hypothetical protein